MILLYTITHKIGKEYLMTTLSKSASSVQRAIEEKGLTCTVIELSSSTRTANEAAESIGCQVGQIIKSLLFCTKETKVAVLVLVSGANRVRERALEALVGEKIVKADADFTKEVTGFAIGGIPPFGHRHPSKYIFVDEDLLQYTTLWAAAGTPQAVFSISSKDLQIATGAHIACIKDTR